MTVITTVADCWLGLCRKRPVMQTTTAVMLGEAETTPPVQPDAGGAAADLGGVRCGIGIATGSIRTVIMDWQLRRFTAIAGLVIIALTIVEGGLLTHREISRPFLFSVNFHDVDMVINMLDILVLAIFLFCFSIMQAALVLYRNGNRTDRKRTAREAYTGAWAHAGPLAALSAVMAIAGILLFEGIRHGQYFGKIFGSIDHALFFLPYAYYIPDIPGNALYHTYQYMILFSLLFLLALYVVPIIVLEKREVRPAVAGSVRLMGKTWQELLGCILVLGAILIVISLVALLIGQSPALLNYDYDFFLQMSRGQVPMTVACYGFLLTCGALMATGLTALGVAVADLYAHGKPGPVCPAPESNTPAVGEPSR